MWEPVNNCTSTWSYTIQHHIQDLGAHEFQLRSYFFGKNLTFVFLPAGCWQGRSPKMFPVSGCLLTVHPVCLGLTRNIGRNPYLLFSPSNKVSSVSHSKVFGQQVDHMFVSLACQPPAHRLRANKRLVINSGTWCHRVRPTPDHNPSYSYLVCRAKTSLVTMLSAYKQSWSYSNF